jgi:sterol-4alpha-carboxylate 3-dehydrogenase (decarboxylating)
MLTVFP